MEDEIVTSESVTWENTQQDMPAQPQENMRETDADAGENEGQGACTKTVQETCSAPPERQSEAPVFWSSTSLEQAPTHIQKQFVQQTAELNRTFGLNVRCVEDILRLPNIEGIVRRMQKGMDMADAYYLANKGAARPSVQAQRQAGINAVRSKAHLRATRPASGGVEEVTDAELAQARTFDESITKKDIADFRRRHKELRRP